MLKDQRIRLLERERFELSKKFGGGILQYEAWGYEEKGKTIVARYNIAYINHTMFSGNNGRVLGYDNAHEYHPDTGWGRLSPLNSSLMSLS